MLLTHHLFIDLKNAYDSIKRSKLYEALLEMNVPNKLIFLVKLTIWEMRCQLRIQSDCSTEFTSAKALRQGDGMSFLLINFALEKVVRDSGIQTRGIVFSHMVQILGYANDLDIVARSRPELEEAFLNLVRQLQQLALL